MEVGLHEELGLGGEESQVESRDDYIGGFFIGVLLLEKSFYYLSIIWHLLSPRLAWGIWVNTPPMIYPHYL